MTLKTDMASDMACFFNTDEFAEDVLYNDGAGPAAILAVVDYGPDGAAPGDQASILVKKSDVSSPAYRQTFTIDSVVWYITPEKGKDFILSQDSTTYLIRISKGEKFSQWRQ